MCVQWRVTDLFVDLRMDPSTDVCVSDPVCSVTPSSVHVYYVSPPVEGGHLHELYFNSAFSWSWKHTVLSLGQQKKFLVRIRRDELLAVPAAVRGPACVDRGGVAGAAAASAADEVPQLGSGGSGVAADAGPPVPYVERLLEVDGNAQNSLRYTAVCDRRCRVYRRGIGGLLGWKFSVM